MSFRLVTSSPTLELSGANVLLANLLDHLQISGIESEWIVTGHNQTYDAAWLGERKFKVSSLPPTRVSDVRRRQSLFLERLKRLSPCVYLPNFDFDIACVAPALPRESRVALIVHCDDPVYYDFVARHGSIFDAIVCVSEFLAGKLQVAQRNLADRVVCIPFGVNPPQELPIRSGLSGRTLEVAYCGRLSRYQKRIHDLAAIINQSHAEKLAVKFHIAGTGPDEQNFVESIGEALRSGSANMLGFLPNADVLQLLSKADVMLMTSEFEGLPIVLLEAMSRGCVPIVTKIKSGVSELIRDRENGLLQRVSDVNGFVNALAELSVNPHRLTILGRAAFDTIRTGGFTLSRAAADYEKLFQSLIKRDAAKVVQRRNGRAILPRQYTFSARLERKLGVLLGAREHLNVLK